MPRDLSREKLDTILHEISEAYSQMNDDGRKRREECTSPGDSDSHDEHAENPADSEHREQDDRARLQRDGAAVARPPPKQFRFCAKYAALTYSQCPVTPEAYEKYARESNWPYSCLYVVREEHKDGGSHLHVLLTSQSKFNTKRVTYFDIPDGTGVIYHPNIKRGYNPRGWLRYMSKQHIPLSWFKTVWVTPDGFTRKKTDWDNFIIFKQSEALTPFTGTICIGSRTWTRVGKRRHLWIVSPPDWGKTTYFENLFTGHQVYCPLQGTYPYDYYQGEDVILYDDIVPKRSHLLVICNRNRVRKPVPGNTRYGVRFLPLDQQRWVIVLSNQHPIYEAEGNIQARFNFITLERPLYEGPRPGLPIGETHEGLGNFRVME